MNREQPRHLLDDVVWNALAGPHQRFAIGDSGVLRYQPQVAPFAALADDSSATMDALHAQIAAHGVLALSTTDAFQAPPGIDVVRHAVLLQMTWQGDTGAGSGCEYVRLGPDDVPDMLALTTQTQPGPFGPRTFVERRVMYLTALDLGKGDAYPVPVT